MSDLVVLIPMLGRPEHIHPLLASLYSTTPSCRVLFLVSPTDLSVIREIDEFGGERVVVPYKSRGDYARKINVGARASKEPLLFLGASDIKFHENWFENAMKHVDAGAQVVGTNDLGNPRVIRGLHATHSLVTREYANLGTIDKPRTVLSEEYVHEYVDDEFVETAKSRGVFAMAMDSVVEHMHPAFGKGKWDASYRETNKRLAQGYRVYKKRRALWT